MSAVVEFTMEWKNIRSVATELGFDLTPVATADDRVHVKMRSTRFKLGKLLRTNTRS
jgi:hypothetical protein